MKNLFRKCINTICIFFMTPILTVLDIMDSFYACRKYKQLFKITDKLYNYYCDTRSLFFTEGGYGENKEKIKSRAKTLKEDSEWTIKATKLLNDNWGEYFNEEAREIIHGEIVLLEEIQKFGEENSQEEST